MQQPLVSHLLRNDVFEAVRGFRHRGFLQHQRLRLQPAQVHWKLRQVGLHRMHRPQNTELKRPAHDARHLQRQLLLRAKPVDAACNHAFDGVRKLHRRKTSCLDREHALPAFDADDAAVPKRVGEFLAEKGMAFGLALDQLRDQYRQRGHAQPPAHQRDGLLGRKAFQAHSARVGVTQQRLSFGRRQRLDRPGHQHQQERLHAPSHRERERPRGRIEPVRILQDQDKRPSLRALAKQPDDQLAKRIGAGLLGHLPDRPAFFQPYRHHHRQQRRPREPLRVFLQLPEDCGADLCCMEATQAEQLRKHRAPWVVGGVLVNGIASAGQHRKPTLAGARDQLLHQARLADARFAFDDHHGGSPGFCQRRQVFIQPATLGQAPDQGDARSTTVHPLPRTGDAVFPGRFTEDRARHRDRLGLAFEHERGRGVERESVGRGILRGRVDQYASLCMAHQPRGEVHCVANNGEHTPDLAALDPGKHAAGGDSGRPAKPLRGQRAEQIVSRAQRTHCVVLVRLAWQSPRRDHRGALVVDDELVESAVVFGDGRSHGRHRRGHSPGRVVRLVVDSRHADEQGDHHAELRKPLPLVRVDPGKDGGRDKVAQCCRGRLTRRGPTRQSGCACAPRSGDAMAAQRDRHRLKLGRSSRRCRCRRRKDDFAHLGLLLRKRNLHQGLARHVGLAMLPSGASGAQQHAAGPNSDPQPQPQRSIARSLKSLRLEGGMHGESAFGRLLHDESQPDRAMHGVRRPDGEHCVPGESGHVAAVLGYDRYLQVGQPVEQAAKSLGP